MYLYTPCRLFNERCFYFYKIYIQYKLLDIQYKSHLAFSEEFVVYITKSLHLVLYYRFVFFKIDKHNVFDLIKFVFY